MIFNFKPGGSKKGFPFLPVLLFSWGLMAAISIVHLLSLKNVPDMPAPWLGYTAWITFVLTIYFLGSNFRKELFGIFCLFFVLGYIAGPFLEPPGDPLDHIRNSYATCSETSEEIGRVNKGLWQYSMLGNIICHERYSLTPEDVLKRIDAANGVFWGTGASVLFVLGLRAGLPVIWAFFSVFLAFLFMGTDSFSYFSYYSFAPSFSSIWIFWLWIAAFFFKSEIRDLLPGITAALFVMPILMVNHIQEAIFMSLVCGVWIFIYLLRGAVKRISSADLFGRYVWWFMIGTFIFSVMFVLPQIQVFQQWLGGKFPHNYWQANQEAVFAWSGIHIMGKMWAQRINDTLGLLGFLPVLLIPWFFFFRSSFENKEKKWHILILGMLPYFVYCIPLINYIWLANCVHLPTGIRYYYRICYSSLFWLPVTLFIYQAGPFIVKVFVNKVEPGKRIAAHLFYAFSLIFVIVLSFVKSGPVYGKSDFILVDSRKWWSEWRPMLENITSLRKKVIETDYVTGYILTSVFNVPIKHRHFNFRWLEQIPKRDLTSMVENSKNHDVGCLVNFHSFDPTWVPFITGHWSPDLARPEIMYILNEQYDSVSNSLNKNHGSCYVYR